MSEMEMLLNMLKGLQDMVTIDNPTDDAMTKAYNLGVDAMRNQVQFYIETIVGVKVGDKQ